MAEDDQVTDEQLPPLPDYATISRAISQHLFDGGESWAGFPMPIEGLSMVLEPKFPRAQELMTLFNQGSPSQVNVAVIGGDPERDDTKKAILRNSWRSERMVGATIDLIEQDGRIRAWIHWPGGSNRRLDMLLNTMMVNKVWDLEREFNAISKLGELVTDDQYLRYNLTGTFAERSKKSGVLYVFRKLRPTLALSTKTHHGFPDDTRNPLIKEGEISIHILAALCMHPIGYYQGTYAGVMCPTDDVLAHLLLMRGDEHRFWRQANQHEADSLEAGL